MDYEFMRKCFPNYTEAMWECNEPCEVWDEGEKRCEQYRGKYGSAFVSNGKLWQGEMNFANGSEVFLCGDVVRVFHTYVETVRQWSSDGSTMHISNNQKPMDEEVAMRTLHKKVDCKMWQLMQEEIQCILKGRKQE